MKAQLFSPLYSIVFVILIISVIGIFTQIINNYKEYNLVNLELKNFETVINLMQDFDNYILDYESSIELNVSINEFVNFSNQDNMISFNNEYDLPNINLQNVNNFNINRVNGEWFINE